nr:MAG TPA: ATP-binding sugar transporter [Caudoviricetes sp.]
MQKILQNLIKSIAENNIEEENYIIDGITYRVDDIIREDGTISIKLVGDKDEIESAKELKDYLNNLDDDVFNKACEQVETQTGKTLNEWNLNNTTSEVLDMFKTVVHNTVRAEIKRLVTYLND